MIPVTNVDGQQVWINPYLVESIKEDEHGGYTLIIFSGKDQIGKVREPAVEVAARINRWYNE